MNITDYWQSLGQVFFPRMNEVSVRDRQVVAQIQDCADRFKSLPSTTLADRIRQTRAQFLARTAISNELRIEVAAALQTAARRTLGNELYEVQLLAGFALSRGAIAEMQTGEGKTLAASLPALLQVIAGRKVHVATPNSYLARRDYELLSPLFESLGIAVGLLPEEATPEEKRRVYGCDVVYGTGYEFGFDYLREQLRLLSLSDDDLGQRYRHRLQGRWNGEPLVSLNREKCFVIVDEIDSVLIDEACLPLILADVGHANAADASVYASARAVAMTLATGLDFRVDSTWLSVRLTECGMRRIYTGHGSSSDRQLRRPWSVYVENALRHNGCFAKTSTTS